MTEQADALIVGGGIAGISAGARLASGAKVIVLERESAPGTHSTGRSAATYIRNYGNATLRALNAASHPDLTEGGYLSPRGLLLVAKPEEGALLDHELDGAEGMAEIGLEEACTLFPILDPAPLDRAAYEPEASDIDVDRLLQSFLSDFRSKSGRLVTGADVLSITRAGQFWRVETPLGAFEAPILVNAAGAWADQIGEMAGAWAKSLTPKRRSVALLPPPEGHDIATWPLAASVAEEWYAKPDTGRLLVSPADQDPVAPMDAWPDQMVLAEGLHRFTLATGMEVTRISHKWAGLRTFAPDKTPVVGFDPDCEGLFWLAGQGGYGIQTSPALSQITADLILRGGTDLVTEAVVAALSPSRAGLN